MRKHGFALDYGIHAEFVQAACRGILTPHPNPLPEGEGIFEIVLKNPIIQSNPVISCHSDRGWSGVLAGIGWVLGPGCSWMAGSGWGNGGRENHGELSFFTQRVLRRSGRAEAERSGESCMVGWPPRGIWDLETISKPVLAVPTGFPSYLFAFTLTLSQREGGLLR